MPHHGVAKSPPPALPAMALESAPCVWAMSSAAPTLRPARAPFRWADASDEDSEPPYPSASPLVRSSVPYLRLLALGEFMPRAHCAPPRRDLSSAGLARASRSLSRPSFLWHARLVEGVGAAGGLEAGKLAGGVLGSTSAPPTTMPLLRNLRLSVGRRDPSSILG